MKNNVNSVSKAVKLALFATAASSVMLSSHVSAQAADANVEDVEKIAVVGSRSAEVFLLLGQCRLLLQ